MAQVEGAGQPARQHVKQLAHRQRAHDVVQNVYQRPARSGFVEQPLNLGLSFTQSRAQLLDFLQLGSQIGALALHSSVRASTSSVSVVATPFSPSPSSSGTTRATAVTRSPSSRLTSLTPCAIRPVTLTWETELRMITPCFVMIMISSAGRTSIRATTSPVFSVLLTVIMPFPPRF